MEQTGSSNSPALPKRIAESEDLQGEGVNQARPDTELCRNFWENVVESLAIFRAGKYSALADTVCRLSFMGSRPGVEGVYSFRQEQANCLAKP